ncbi:hypothetical protein [Tardiphaga sp. vice154]|nr:hypothetical protein [Tardiphaga sp. vice154]
MSEKSPLESSRWPAPSDYRSDLLQRLMEENTELRQTAVKIVLQNTVLRE